MVNACQQDKPIENWDGVKYLQLNKRQKEGEYNKYILKVFMMYSSHQQ